MHHHRVLVIDDDLAIIKLLLANLKAEGYEMLSALDGAQGLDTFERELPDLIILDIMLPKLDGFELCRRLREWSQIPIIMLSARCEEQDKVKCLNLGADDYMSKPFGINELIARIRALFRRTQSTGTPTQPVFSSGDLKIDFAQRKVTVAGEEIKLTQTEFSLLQELALNAGKVLTHAQLLSKIWGPEYMTERGHIHTFIHRLRDKIECGRTEFSYIDAVPRVGYRLRANN
jgi:two-component system KDP operon response regulator KdpE